VVRFTIWLIPAGEEFPAQTEQKGGYVGKRFYLDMVMQRKSPALPRIEPGHLVLIYSLY
jgi:hypothetical protein